MSKNWHYAKDGEKHGPITSAQLKELANSGQLSPDDLVWREDMKEWRKASTIKGLLSSSPNFPTPPPPPPLEYKDSQDTSLWANPAIIALVFLLFWPAGIFLLWRKFSSSASRSHNISKSWIYAGVGVLALMFVGGIVVTIAQKSVAQKEIAQASDLWEQGQHDKAVGIYQSIISKRGPFIPDDQKPLVYGRVIDHLAEGGNEDEIEQLVRLADRSVPKITPFVETERGKSVLAASRAGLDGDVLSERYFPYKKGSTREMFGDLNIINSRSFAEYEVTHPGSGVITKRMTYHYTVKNGKTVLLPLLPESSEIRRVRNGYVEIRSSDYIGKDEDGWTPIIKIGAVVGDSWTGSFEDQHFKFTGWKTKHLNGQEIRCAVIEEKIDGLISTRTELLYSIDHGLVSETVYKVEGIEETYVRSLLIDGLRGDENER